MRRYGFAKRDKEDTSHCVAQVEVRGVRCLYQQCSRKRWTGQDGLYCRQHANMIADDKLVLVPVDKPESEGSDE